MLQVQCFWRYSFNCFAHFLQVENYHALFSFFSVQTLKEAILQNVTRIIFKNTKFRTKGCRFLRQSVRGLELVYYYNYMYNYITQISLNNSKYSKSGQAFLQGIAHAADQLKILICKLEGIFLYNCLRVEGNLKPKFLTTTCIDNTVKCSKISRLRDFSQISSNLTFVNNFRGIVVLYF